jgi:hypothetical protein
MTTGTAFMKPIYFPYTYVSKSMLDRLNFFFRRITVYQPCALSIHDDLKAFEDKGLVDIGIPVQGDEPKIAGMLKEYNHWAAMHQGRDMAFLKTQERWPPFFTETSTAQIKKEIRENTVPGSPDSPTLNEGVMLFNARVFLLIAQQMDRQHHQSAICLETADAMERTLFKQLKGESETGALDTGPGKVAPRDDLRDYMILERLHAFGHLVQHAEKTSGIFVTDNRSVMEYLLEKSPQMKLLSNAEALLPAENAKATHMSWQERFQQNLEMLVTASVPVDGDRITGGVPEKAAGSQTNLTLYRAAGLSPRACFENCTAIEGAAPASDQGSAVSLKNTIIGFVER